MAKFRTRFYCSINEGLDEMSLSVTWAFPDFLEVPIHPFSGI